MGKHFFNISAFNNNSMAVYVKGNTVVFNKAEVQVYFDLTPIDFNCSMKHIFFY